jgi:hypothetical protein
MSRATASIRQFSVEQADGLKLFAVEQAVGAEL